MFLFLFEFNIKEHFLIENNKWDENTFYLN